MGIVLHKCNYISFMLLELTNGSWQSNEDMFSKLSQIHLTWKLNVFILTYSLELETSKHIYVHFSICILFIRWTLKAKIK